MTLDLTHALSMELTVVATTAFSLGLRDKERKCALKREELMAELSGQLGGLQYEKFHQTRLYAVYTAGRNMGIQNAMVKQRESKP